MQQRSDKRAPLKIIMLHALHFSPHSHVIRLLQPQRRMLIGPPIIFILQAKLMRFDGECASLDLEALYNTATVRVPKPLKVYVCQCTIQWNLLFRSPIGHDQGVSSFQGWFCTIKHDILKCPVSIFHKVGSEQFHVTCLYTHCYICVPIIFLIAIKLTGVS